MSNNVKDLLKRRNEMQEAKQAKQAKQPAPQKSIAIEVEGEAPEIAPEVGDIVILAWGDPKLVGGPLVDIPMVVTLADPQSGRLNGEMILDPTMQGMGPDGRPAQMPPIAPVANIPHSKEPRAMTWRHSGLKLVVGRLLARVLYEESLKNKQGEQPVAEAPKPARRSRKAVEVPDDGPTTA